MSKALLLDTSSVFFRAYHALPPMQTRSGVPTGALYGTSSLLLKLLREERPSALAMALDSPVATFRHVAFQAYKATRKPLPDALRAQLARLPALLDALGVPAHCAPGFEADDVLATLAGSLRGSGEGVRIVTGDRDLFQVIDDRVDVLFIGRRGEKPVVYDAERVEARFGVSPRKYALYLALLGDSSDNLPGVKGIGARSAAKLAARFENAAELVAHAAEIEPASLRDTIRAAADQILSNEPLAALRWDVPLGAAPLASAVSKSAVPRLRALFEELEFKSLIPRLDLLEPTLSDP
jgi:DNA polymerase-1